MGVIACLLFPTYPTRVGYNSVESAEDCSLFTMKELEGAIFSMENKKAPGLGGIPAEVYNASLKEGISPSRWKIATLASISKGRKQPLCMLNTFGKAVGKLNRSRLAKAIHATGNLPPRQRWDLSSEQGGPRRMLS